MEGAVSVAVGVNLLCRSGLGIGTLCYDNEREGEYNTECEVIMKSRSSKTYLSVNSSLLKETRKLAVLPGSKGSARFVVAL